jgi:hypothetical protein
MAIVTLTFDKPLEASFANCLFMDFPLFLCLFEGHKRSVQVGCI